MFLLAKNIVNILAYYSPLHYIEFIPLWNAIYSSLINCNFTANYIDKLKAVNKDYIDSLVGKSVKSKYLIGVLYQLTYKALQNMSYFVLPKLK